MRSTRWGQDPEPDPEGPYNPSAGVLALAAGVPTVIGGGALFVCIVACVGVIVWAVQTHETKADVTAMSWEHTTLVQRWTDVSVREWRHKTFERAEVKPVGGSGERSGKELLHSTCRSEHYDNDRYPCGTERRCTGSGESRSCRNTTKYCSRPIYRDRCSYRTQLWQTVKTSNPESGTGHDTRWPQLEVGLLDRLRFQALYTVKVDYSDGGDLETHVMNPGGTILLLGSPRELDTTEALAATAAYKAWHVGQPVVLDINNLGSVRDVRPAQSTP